MIEPLEEQKAPGYEPPSSLPQFKSELLRRLLAFDLVRKFVCFDLLDALGKRFIGFADSPAAVRDRGGAPDVTPKTIGEATRAVFQDPHKRRIFLLYAGLVGIFVALLVSLVVTGTLGSFYRWLYTTWPGRPWTQVMRENPLIYAGLAVPLAVIPFWAAPPNRWGRAFLTFVLFLLGFLAGHVFW